MATKKPKLIQVNKEKLDEQISILVFIIILSFFVLLIQGTTNEIVESELSYSALSFIIFFSITGLLFIIFLITRLIKKSILKSLVLKNKIKARGV